MLSGIYRTDLGLLTDLYQLTMCYGYHRNRMQDREAVFHLFYRKEPFGGDYAIAAGLESVVEYLQNLTFSVHDIQYLGGLTGNDGEALFDERFLNFLQRAELSLDIDAVPEGTLVHAHEPLLRVRGPIWQAQLVETALLNLMNFSTLIATKAHRIVRAAGGDPVLEFGLRRAQGIDGGLTASRAAYLGGCAATSNVLAGRLFGIPVRGTHAHSWVMAFGDEPEAFESYARAMPGNCTFLVDTYDTEQGVRRAITVGRQLRERGYEMNGIRLDSGDLAELSKLARRLLDEAGFPNAKIVASNDLDEYKIQQLKESGATITVWGVGTNLVTARDQPALGGVYKLAAVENDRGELEDRVKLSNTPIKVSNPGVQQVARFFQEDARTVDVIYDERHPPERWAARTFDGSETLELSGAFQNLLVPIFRKGNLVYEMPTLKQIRSFCGSQTVPTRSSVLLEANLFEKKQTLVAQHRATKQISD